MEIEAIIILNTRKGLMAVKVFYIVVNEAKTNLI
jgi:hypothetical protein